MFLSHIIPTTISRPHHLHVPITSTLCQCQRVCFRLVCWLCYLYSSHVSETVQSLCLGIISLKPTHIDKNGKISPFSILSYSWVGFQSVFEHVSPCVRETSLSTHQPLNKFLYYPQKYPGEVLLDLMVLVLKFFEASPAIFHEKSHHILFLQQCIGSLPHIRHHFCFLTSTNYWWICHQFMKT